MNLYIPAVMATAVMSALLGVIVFLRAPDRLANRLYAVHAGCVALWALVTCLVHLPDDPAKIDLLLHLAHLAGLWVLVTYLDFAWVFPERLRPPPPGPRRVLFGSAALFSALIAHPDLVGVAGMEDGFPVVQFGWPMAGLGAYVVALVAHVWVVLWRKARVLHGVARLQTTYVLAGAVTTGGVMALLLAVLPAVTSRGEYSRWGVVAYLLMVSVLAIAIAKHRLWDLSSLERRAAAGALAVGSLLLPAAGFVWLVALRAATAMEGSRVLLTAGLVAGAILGLCLAPVYNAFRGLLSRSLQEESQRISRFLGTLGAAVVHAPTGGATLMPILVETQQFFGASFVEAYLRRPDGHYQNAGAVNPDAAGVQGSGGQRLLADSVVQALHLATIAEPIDAGQLVRFGEVERAAKQFGAMEMLGAEVVVPLRWQAETIGMMVLGPKLSRDVYSTSDLSLLDSVATHAAIAARNAELREEILAEKERTEKVLTQMESGVIVVDADGYVRLVNPAACLLLGQREQQLLEWRLGDLPRELRRLLDAAVASGSIVSAQRVEMGDAGGLRVACSTFILRGPKGSREGAGIVFRDLRTEDALARFEREAEQLRFIRAISAGMAHEIRNPLVAIRTFAELAPTRLDDPEFRDSFLHVAQAEITRLEELVSQFMTLAKPTRDVRLPVDVPGLLETVATTMSATADAKDIQISVAVPPGLRRPLGDEDRLHQALVNLVLNAVDATPRGGRIELSAREELVDGVPHMGVTVWNSGSYIQPEDRERVFEPFYTSKVTGTGLGLAICKTIADEHGGTTRLESVEGSGTAFTITVPTIPAPSAVAEAIS